MQHDPPETAELLAFVAVIDNGSIAAAADELGLPRATISRRLARLEERLATRLIRRTTRQLALTDAGRELDPHARRIVEAVQQAAKSLQLADGAPRGLLRVSAPPGPAGLFDDVLVEFMARYPHVQLEVERSTRQVDLVAGGFDVALRATSHLHPGLVARRLATVSVGVVAAPSYLARQGTPRDPADLADHAALDGYDRGERPSTHWPLLDGGSVRVNARMASNDLGLLGRAAAAGEGLALLIE
jgi:DNA-binding transcriptional LysR family regulator